MVMKVNKLEQPKQTFFFERHDGSIIAVGEQEASNLYYKKNQVVGFDIPKPKLIGVSNGKTTYEAIKEAHQIFRDDPDKAMDRIRKGQADELEIARGNIIIPKNFDKMGDGAGLI